MLGQKVALVEELTDEFDEVVRDGGRQKLAEMNVKKHFYPF